MNGIIRRAHSPFSELRPVSQVSIDNALLHVVSGYVGEIFPRIYSTMDLTHQGSDASSCTLNSHFLYKSICSLPFLDSIEFFLLKKFLKLFRNKVGRWLCWQSVIGRNLIPRSHVKKDDMVAAACHAIAGDGGNRRFLRAAGQLACLDKLQTE